MVELLLGIQVVFGILMFLVPQLAVTILAILYYRYYYDIPDREERRSSLTG